MEESAHFTCRKAECGKEIACLMCTAAEDRTFDPDLVPAKLLLAKVHHTWRHPAICMFQPANSTSIENGVLSATL